MRRYLFLGIMVFLIVAGVSGCEEDNPTGNDRESVRGTAVADETAGALNTPTPTGAPTPLPTETPMPTATPLPPKAITICMAGPPDSLYLYGDPSLPARALRSAIYEAPYHTLTYAYQPRGLAKLPSLADGDVRVETVTAEPGQMVVDAAGQAIRLGEGVQVFNSEGTAVTAGDGPIQMQQMTVEFTLQPLVWSDGTPVTAADSVFSFQIAADRNTPVSKQAVQRTASYTALDEQTVQWTGLPGHLDPDFLNNFWQPLPRHQLEEYSAAELREAPQTNRTPLSSGPFVVESWDESEMRLTRNSHYYRPEQPALDEITVRFGVDAEGVLADGFADCDVTTQDALDFSLIPELAALGEEGTIALHVAPNAVFEHVDFGIDSWEDYGDGAPLGRPDWFEDARARQAITMCTDRERMVEEIFYGRSQVMPAYVPLDHPLLPDDLNRWSYDPAAGNALLDEVGFLDTDGDGIREAPEPDPVSGEIVPFRVTLTTEWENPVRRQLTEMMQADLAECGIAVELEYLPPEEWYADGPLGPLFGRRFDLGAFAWLGGVRPPCHLWLAGNVPGPEAEGFGGWGNVNVSGWQDEAFDAACRAAANSLPGTEAYVANHQTALRRFADQLPTMPLFSYVNVTVVSPTLRGFQPNPTEPSSLWNIYAWDVPR